MVLARVLAVAIGLAIAAGTAFAQAIDSGAVFRVFLKSGQALPSYGESAIVGDRVVFNLLVGAADARPTTQLMSLPADRVDLARTRRYANAMRARHYAETRGEVDFATMAEEVRRTVTQLTAVEEPKRRLELAEDAKRRLLAWSAGTYGYRAADVRELLGLFDEVIIELRAAAGERRFALDLRTGPAAEPPEPLMDAPAIVESIELALAAARAADGEDDRLAVLRAANELLGLAAVPSDVYTAVRRELEDEARAATAYTELFSLVRTRADQARRRGDVPAVEAAILALRSGDQALGTRRPQSVAALTMELATILDATRTHRAALDRYARVRRSLLHYERMVRPAMSGFDGLAPILTALREFRHTAYERLERTAVRLSSYRATLDAVTPPEDLADVHASLDNALRMADYACARRRLAMSTGNETMDREASSAAAGALMLASVAREQLVARLYPPKVK